MTVVNLYTEINQKTKNRFQMETILFKTNSM